MPGTTAEQAALESLKQFCIATIKKLDASKGVASCKAHDGLSDSQVAVLRYIVAQIEIGQNMKFTMAKIAGSVTAIALVLYTIIDHWDMIAGILK